MHVRNNILLGINVLLMLETVANNIISSINALIDYNTLGNRMKIENVTIPGKMPCRTVIRL